MRKIRLQDVHDDELEELMMIIGLWPAEDCGDDRAAIGDALSRQSFDLFRRPNGALTVQSHVEEE